MKLNETPLWRIVFRGIAAENLELGKKTIEVFCPELSGFTQGEITSHRQEMVTEGVDFLGNHYTCNLVTSNTITATWRPQETNRVTPPDIRRGERLEIWQYEYTDMFYWTATGEDEHLRRLETVRKSYSNTQDESVEELDETNTYSVMVSTHQKIISLDTSNSDGEPFTHHIQLDTRNGNVHYRDSKGNYIQVESEANRITLENASASKVVLDKEDIGIIAPKTVRVQCKDYIVNAKTITETAKTISETAKSKTVKADIATKGSLTNDGTNISDTHTHGGVKGGSSSTSTPN